VNVLYNSDALGFGAKSSFKGAGGTAPYAYSVVSGGIGGQIDSNGVYTAPNQVGHDTVKVTDSLGRIAIKKVFVGTAQHLLCDIIQKQLGLADGRVYLFDQKIFMPTDEVLFVAVSALSCKPFGSKTQFSPLTNEEELTANFYAQMQIDIISRGTDALFRKEEVVLAMRSTYAEQQQALNSFHIGPLPNGFTNLSQIDGSAIPYRFSITVALQYQVRKTGSIQHFDQFETPSLTVDP
jgi:hypothetical protein